MAIIYHFANPDIINIIHLSAFIILIIAGFNIKKKNEAIEKPNLFLISGIIGTIWFVISFLIPAYMFTAPPTPAEIQYTYIYSLIWHNLVPSIILVVIFGIISIILGLKNLEYYGLWIVLSGIFFITSMLLDLFSILAIIIFIGLMISSCFYLYFCIRLKNPYLIIFSVLSMISLTLPAIGVMLYIPIF
ncbi:MAG: hypothetical protein ACFE9S_16235 [Candidatus Hermodarchaeota archaeon]